MLELMAAVGNNASILLMETGEREKERKRRQKWIRIGVVLLLLFSEEWQPPPPPPLPIPDHHARHEHTPTHTIRENNLSTSMFHQSFHFLSLFLQLKRSIRTRRGTGWDRRFVVNNLWEKSHALAVECFFETLLTRHLVNDRPLPFFIFFILKHVETGTSRRKIMVTKTKGVRGRRNEGVCADQWLRPIDGTEFSVPLLSWLPGGQGP